MAQPERRQIPFAQLAEFPAEQSGWRHAVEPTVHAHAGQGDIDRQRLGHRVRAQLEQARREGTHRPAKLAPQRLAQLAGRQPTGSTGHAAFVFIAPAVLHRLQ